VASQIWYFIRRWPLIPMIILALLLVCGIFAPLIAPTDGEEQKLPFRNFPPTWGRSMPQNVEPDPADYDLTTGAGRSAYSRAKQNYFPRSQYILGGDNLGRDVLSRVIFGARISLQVVAIALISGILIGTTMGLVAGYFGKLTDEVLMRFVDMWNALPFILIALVVAITLGTTTTVVMILLAMLAWTPFVRQVRADALRIRNQDYVLASKIGGGGAARIIWKHVLPGTYSTVLVVASLRVGSLILAESILSFLGVGIPDPIPAWGKSVSEGRPYIESAWWVSVMPGLAIFLVVMSLNFFGDWLRDRLDPRLRQLD
jgi:peptide/nickel transport system permease protein